MSKADGSEEFFVTSNVSPAMKTLIEAKYPTKSLMTIPRGGRIKSSKTVYDATSYTPFGSDTIAKGEVDMKLMELNLGEPEMWAWTLFPVFQGKKILEDKKAAAASSVISNPLVAPKPSPAMNVSPPSPPTV